MASPIGEDEGINALDRLCRPDRYPRSAAYDAAWLLQLDMGPHPLWQLEDLLADIALPADAHVLDLGAGKGATSVYLAREYGVTVTSLDLWVPAKEREHVCAAEGVAERVTAIEGDVRTVDLGNDVFDAIVSVDAFEYFGTDVHLLPTLLPALKSGGWLAMSTPALREDPYAVGIPPHVERVLGWEAAAWHTPDWWARHWELSGMLTDVRARWQDGGRDSWLLWEQARRELTNEAGPSAVLEMLRADTDEQIGFALVSARKR
ncbi:MAG TPA: methyltransferase domain-containing protein [Actinopolymorphaceae bacterium]